MPSLRRCAEIGRPLFAAASAILAVMLCPVSVSPPVNFGDIVTLEQAGLTMQIQPGFICQKKDEHCDQRATRQPSSPNATQYQNGIDFHFDWGASHFLSKQLFVGMVGYAYQQVTDDIGTAPFLNGFQSRVFGFLARSSAICSRLATSRDMNFKGYREFASENRPEGWNVWLTFAISNAAPTSTVTPTRHSITK